MIDCFFNNNNKALFFYPNQLLVNDKISIKCQTLIYKANFSFKFSRGEKYLQRIKIMKVS